jgi:hypothetical protein
MLSRRSLGAEAGKKDVIPPITQSGLRSSRLETQKVFSRGRSTWIAGSSQPMTIFLFARGNREPRFRSRAISPSARP